MCTVHQQRQPLHTTLTPSKQHSLSHKHAQQIESKGSCEPSSLTCRCCCCCQLLLDITVTVRISFSVIIILHVAAAKFHLHAFFVLIFILEFTVAKRREILLSADGHGID